MDSSPEFDVIVVGGGHAGAEAALAVARMGHRAACVVLAPEAILFDLDGVLADVSSSYRAAIVQTAAHFGVTVAGAEIAALKAEDFGIPIQTGNFRD